MYNCYLHGWSSHHSMCPSCMNVTTTDTTINIKATGRVDDAYAALQKENEELVKQLDENWVTHQRVVKAEQENDSLREHLRIAVEALNQISRTRTYHVAEGELYRSQALSALNKIKLKET